VFVPSDASIQRSTAQDQLDQLVCVRLDFVHMGDEYEHHAFVPRYRVKACFAKPENHIKFDDVPALQVTQKLQANWNGYRMVGQRETCTSR